MSLVKNYNHQPEIGRAGERAGVNVIARNINRKCVKLKTV